MEQTGRKGRGKYRCHSGPPFTITLRAKPVTRVLFVCTQNQLRSPTAEQVFANRAGFEVASAGVAPGAGNPVTPELLEWADVVFVMEETHREKLAKQFRSYLKNKRVVCLDIPDEFAYMDPALVDLLEKKCGAFFRSK